MNHKIKYTDSQTVKTIILHLLHACKTTSIVQKQVLRLHILDQMLNKLLHTVSRYVTYCESQAAVITQGKYAADMLQYSSSQREIMHILCEYLLKVVLFLEICLMNKISHTSKSSILSAL